MRRFVALACVVFVLLGCASKPKETEATDKELEPVDVPANGAVPQVGAAAPEGAKPTRAEPAHGDQGPVATIIYVTEVLTQRGGPKKPGAVIFSSDPASPYIQDRPRPTRVLKPVDRARMGQLVAQLEGAGLGRLRAEAQLAEEPVTGERQFIIFKDGKRLAYRRSTTQADAEAFKLFNACEKVLVDASHERDEYVETMGREATSDFKPLHPDR